LMDERGEGEAFGFWGVSVGGQIDPMDIQGVDEVGRPWLEVPTMQPPPV
jgi:hypothetical protein